MFLPTKVTEATLEAISKINSQNPSALVENCVHAILVLGQDGCPIKKQDLNKLVFPNISYRGSAALLLKANSELSKVFGMRLYEYDDKSKYLLVNKDPQDPEILTKYMKDENYGELAVLYFVLLEIFLSPDEKSCEKEIKDSIKLLNLSADQVKNYIDSFVKKLYLSVDKRNDTRLYLWGPRAIAEIEPVEFFNRFLDLVDDQTSGAAYPELQKRIDKLASLRNGN